MKLRKKKKGFTLIEMVIVMAIMGILIGLVAPGAMKQVDQAKARQDITAAREVALAITQGAAEGKINLSDAPSDEGSADEVVLSGAEEDPDGIEEYLEEFSELKLAPNETSEGENYPKFYYYYDDKQIIHILVVKSDDDSNKYELFPNYDPEYAD